MNNTSNEILSTLKRLNEMMNALVQALKETVDESTSNKVLARAWDIFGDRLLMFTYKVNIGKLERLFGTPIDIDV